MSSKISITAAVQMLDNKNMENATALKRKQLNNRCFFKLTENDCAIKSIVVYT